jgi:hypothetical protein
MIGLVDYDLQSSNSINLHPPNLEIMKLATYYKVQGQQFCKLVPLDATELSAYERIYFFSEAETQPPIPPQFLRANNVFLGGTAFTNGIYQPFKQTAIDFMLAKPAIYKEYLMQCYNDGKKIKAIEHILDDSYYRQVAGDSKLPLPPILPKKRLWIYDIDFFQDGWSDWVDEAERRKCSTINTIHPIVCSKLSNFIAIRNKPKISRSNTIVLDIGIPLEDTRHLFNEYGFFLIADITQASTVYLKIGGTFKSNMQHYKDLIYKLNLLYCFWSNRIPIKLKYFPPRIGTSCDITHLLRAIELWANSENHKWTINDKITRKKMKEPTVEYAEELKILKYFPDVADLFTQNYTDLSTRRFWRI